MAKVKDEIIEIVNRETKAWDTQDVELFLSIFHRDMVWPWPTKNTDHDPIYWKLPLGNFDQDRWKGIYTKFFDRHALLHNHRKIIKIEMSNEGDGAFAVVDIDTLWRNKSTKETDCWFGRVCKVYAKVGNEWKLTMHTGALEY